MNPPSDPAYRDTYQLNTSLNPHEAEPAPPSKKPINTQQRSGLVDRIEKNLRSQSQNYSKKNTIEPKKQETGFIQGVFKGVVNLVDPEDSDDPDEESLDDEDLHNFEDNPDHPDISKSRLTDEIHQEAVDEFFDGVSSKDIPVKPKKPALEDSSISPGSTSKKVGTSGRLSQSKDVLSTFVADLDGTRGKLIDESFQADDSKMEINYRQNQTGFAVETPGIQTKQTFSFNGFNKKAAKIWVGFENLLTQKLKLVLV
jgi:hypothetical protein